MEKIQNLILYFCSNTENIHLGKLIRLVYFADIEYYIKSLGNTISGWRYQVLEYGPNLEENIIQEFDLQENSIYNLSSFIQNENGIFTSKKEANLKCFSELERHTIFRVANAYKVGGQPSMYDEIFWHKGCPWRTSFNLKKFFVDFNSNIEKEYGIEMLNEINLKLGTRNRC